MGLIAEGQLKNYQSTDWKYGTLHLDPWITRKFITLEVTLTHVFDNALCHCNGSIFIASLSRGGGLCEVDGFFSKHRVL